MCQMQTQWKEDTRSLGMSAWQKMEVTVSVTGMVIIPSPWYIISAKSTSYFLFLISWIKMSLISPRLSKSSMVSSMNLLLTFNFKTCISASKGKALQVHWWRFWGRSCVAQKRLPLVHKLNVASSFRRKKKKCFPNEESIRKGIIEVQGKFLCSVFGELI